MGNTQSAVEWLMNQITFEEDDENNPEGKGRFASFQDYVNLKKYFDKAKAIEKQQIIDAHLEGWGDAYDYLKDEFLEARQAENYYNETYGNAND